jgi:hypothetical protein
LDVIELGAVDRHIGSVVNSEVVTYQTNIRDPVIHLFSPVNVRLIASIPTESRRKLEEACIRNGIFVVVPVVESEYLPSKASGAGLIVPPTCLEIENGLGES